MAWRKDKGNHRQISEQVGGGCLQDNGGKDDKGLPAAAPPDGETVVTQPLATHGPSPGQGPRRRRRRYVWEMLRSALAMVAFLGLIVGGSVFGVLALTGKTLNLPAWVVKGVERQITGALPDDLSVQLGAVEVLVDADWVPRLRVQDMRLLAAGGTRLVSLPEARVVFDPASFAKGEIRPSVLRLTGAQVALRRDRQGRFNLDFGAGELAQVDSFAALMDAVEAAFDVQAASALQSIEVTGLTLTLTDDLTGQVWQVGDGRLAIANRPDALAAELGLSLSGAVETGQVQMSFATTKGNAAAQITAQVTDVAANDLAAQVVPLGFLAALDAPLSGKLEAALNAEGAISTLEGVLDIGAGAITPNAQTAPISFEGATIALAYDPAKAAINITDLNVRSATAAFAATGQLLLQGAAFPAPPAPPDGPQVSLPAAFVAQLAMRDIRIDPEGAFETPVTFGEGALDLRLQLDPFRIDVGQFALVEGEQHLLASGWAEGRADGWHAGMDVALDQIAADRLVALWPLRLVPNTRKWLAENVQQGALSNVNGAVRLTPGAEPRLQLGYEFSQAEVRFLRSLPPITAGTGYAVLQGQRYIIVLDAGTVAAPLGGDINVAGSTFEIADISQRPNIARIGLATQSSVTAALSLLDLPPFGFMTKADRPVDLGEGQAVVKTDLTIPLVSRVQLADVDYTVAGQISDFSSSKLVPGRSVRAERLELRATPAGMEISGAGRLGQLPFDVTYSQGFDATARGRSRVAGVVTISGQALADLGVALPEGFLRGQGPANVEINLQKGAPASLTLTSRLAGIGLALPELGWSKPRDTRGELTVEARLSTPPEVTRIDLSASGLRASGEITLRDGGGLREARFSRLEVDDWFDAAVTLTGQGRGRSTVAVTGGTIDLRRVPRREDGGNGGSPFTLRLDRLIVTDAIAFTGFSGDFSPRGGLNGSFTAGVNGQGAVAGTVVPSANGSAVRIRSDDAGTVMAAAGVFSTARGGTLDLQLTPRSQAGTYDGRAELSRLRVRNANVLAELLNAISVVGLLEQLNGSGIVFNDAEVDFLLTPRAIEISRASAIGASLGVSMAGVYQTANRELNMQGVISPIYIVNGVGAVLTRRGEGLFGFNYRMRGTADAPQVSVNPLSILTPGMFRDLFRRPPPVLGGTD
ncbi:MAG: hypothetical protein RLZZ437_1410 [Pseudomonadota bacterium]|jgi:hypothetical protein